MRLRELVVTAIIFPPTAVAVVVPAFASAIIFPFTVAALAAYWALDAFAPRSRYRR
jgi:hypothetical protein